jgi:hypothetical protein
MEHLLCREGIFEYRLIPLFLPTSAPKTITQSKVMGILIDNVEGDTMKLLKRYKEPCNCLNDLKFCYESKSGLRRHSLIERFFNLRKIVIMSMDAYLVEIHNATNQMEDLGCKMPKDVVIYFTIHHLLKEYTVFKHMYGKDPLPSFNP